MKTVFQPFLYSQPVWVLDIVSVNRVFDPTLVFSLSEDNKTYSISRWYYNVYLKDKNNTLVDDTNLHLLSDLLCYFSLPLR